MKSAMVKQVSNKGFTLIEMLLVLFVISMLVLLFPFVKPQKRIQFSYELSIMKTMLQMTQVQAMQKHSAQSAILSSSMIEAVGERYFFSSGMRCTSAKVTFGASGKATHAQTITCSCQGTQKQLVIEVGGNCIYVR